MRLRRLFHRHTVSIHVLSRTNFLFILAFIGHLLCSVVPTTEGFVTYDQNGFHDLNILIRKIDKPQWVIGYRFTETCPAEFREKEELKKLITEILQAWLQPLRELHPDRPITDDFRFILTADCPMALAMYSVRTAPLHLHKLHVADQNKATKFDVRITFVCDVVGRSSVSITRAIPPDMYIKGRGTDISGYIVGLVHELGHAFGLADTYIDLWRETTGGLDRTWGKQPSSVMAALSGGAHGYIEEDDWRGIVWLYKYLYEQQPIDDCFFPDYVFEAEIRGCRPEHLLIYEAKHGFVPPVPHVGNNVTVILRDDPTLDVNARDASGFTALHYAVMRGNIEGVKSLLAHKAIKVNILSKDKRTPAQLASEFKLPALVKLINAHPTAKLRPWSVTPKDKLTTTWGHLKKRY